MGSLTPDLIRFPTSWFAANDNDDLTMPSYSYETSFTSEFSASNTSSTSSSSANKMSRASSVSSELDELLYQSFNMTDKDKRRLFREFYYPPRISASGNYYPRFKVQGDSQTGTSHVSYLARPYFSYLVPSCYPGYSKYVYITKLNWRYNREHSWRQTTKDTAPQGESHIKSKILTQTNIDGPCHDVQFTFTVFSSPSRFWWFFTNVLDSSSISINQYEKLSYFSKSH